MDPTDHASQTDLSDYTVGDFKPGRGKLTQILWYYCSLLVFESGWLPVHGLKCAMLRWFGATVGRGVVIKPNVRIKYPWRLSIGDFVWIGQAAWIDNLAEVTIGSHACLSQGVYLCTGSHNAHSAGFELKTEPITIGDGAWVAARTMVLQGVTFGPNSMAAAGSVVIKDVPATRIVGGNPAKPIGNRSHVCDPTPQEHP